jgi:hypothetical protein
MVGGGGGLNSGQHIRRMDHASRTSTHTLEPRDRYRSSGIELRGNFEPRVEDTLAVAGVDVVVVGAEASVAKGKRVGISRQGTGDMNAWKMINWPLVLRTRCRSDHTRKTNRRAKQPCCWYCQGIGRWYRPET